MAANDDISLDEERDARARSRLGATLQGKYRLDRVLGVGGMATVYAATHRNGMQVALKLLHPELAYHAEVRSRFLREGYVANHVGHDGVVAVLDDDVTDDGLAFLVMELLSGVTVEELWNARQVLNPALVVTLTLALLDVMVSAHEAGVVHRDLKPANLFLTASGEVKVLDFGIARMRIATGGATTNTGTLLGTPAFMAPEQALAKSDQIDERTDIWAVGAVAFALLVGDIVHPADNTQQTLVYAATHPARSLADAARSVPGPVAKVFDKALAFEREARWTTARAMRQALLAAAHESYGQVPSAEVIRTALDGIGISRPAVPHADTLDLPASEDAPPPRSPTPTDIERLSTVPGDMPSPPSLRRLRADRGAGSSAPPVSAPAFVASSALARATVGRRRLAFAAAVGIATTIVLTGLARTPAAATPVSASLKVARITEEPGQITSSASDAAVDALRPPPLEVAEESSPLPAPTPAPRATAEPPHPRVTPAPSSSALALRASCTPPFVIEAKTGRKRWKLDCL
jgi:eukaryotic-like serine/threonine-protein kinase